MEDEAQHARSRSVAGRPRDGSGSKSDLMRRTEIRLMLRSVSPSTSGGAAKYLAVCYPERPNQRRVISRYLPTTQRGLMKHSGLTSYERTALAQIHEWKHPDVDWFGSALKMMNKPVELVGSAVMKIPGASIALERSLGGMLRPAQRWCRLDRSTGSDPSGISVGSLQPQRDC